MTVAKQVPAAVPAAAFLCDRLDLLSLPVRAASRKAFGTRPGLLAIGKEMPWPAIVLARNTGLLPVGLVILLF